MRAGIAVGGLIFAAGCAGATRPEESPAKTDAPAAANAPEPLPDAAELLAKWLGEPLGPETAAAARDRTDRLRRDLLHQADGAEGIVAKQMFEEIRRERADREDAMRGGTMKFLERLHHDRLPWELLRSPEKFAALFERKTNADVVDGATLDWKSPPADGTTIRFPVGHFALNMHAMNGWRSFPKDLVIEGAGMDETLLVMSEPFETRDSVHSLTLRGATFDANSHYFEELRHSPYTLRVDKCRIVGFDMGAGNSSMLGGSIGAFYATDSRIEAGFSRARAGYGNLLDVRDGLLARLENCDIVGPFESVFYEHRAAQVYSKCRFARMSPRVKTSIEHARDAVEFLDCTFDYLTPEAQKAIDKPRPLSDLNPSWSDAKKR